MPLIAGTVSVAPNGTAIFSPPGQGLAESIYTSFVDSYLADTGETMPFGSDSYAIKKGYMVQANRLASAIVTYIRANAAVSGVATSVALGIPVTVVPATGVGATTAPGTGAQTGTGVIL